jgi:hypothetical protein
MRNRSQVQPTRAKRPSGTRGATRTAPPPAPVGNKRGLRHGAHAEPDAVLAAGKAQALTDVLAAAAPVRDGAGGLPEADRAMVVLLARTLCRLEAVGEWLDANGPLDRRGRPRSALRAESKLSNQAVAYFKELGLTPRSRAALGLDLARVVDLASAMSEPDPERRAALLRQAGLQPGPGGGDLA